MLTVLLSLALFWPPPAAACESRLPVAVRPTDLDSKGHVNHARHLEYLQWARWRWLEDRGLSDESLRAEGAVIVVVRVEIDYRAECRYGETLEVSTTAERDGEKKLVFRQQIRRPDGTLAAEARVIMVAIDPVARKSRPLPESLRKAITPNRGASAMAQLTGTVALSPADPGVTRRVVTIIVGGGLPTVHDAITGPVDFACASGQTVEVQAQDFTADGTGSAITTFSGVAALSSTPPVAPTITLTFAAAS